MLDAPLSVLFVFSVSKIKRSLCTAQFWIPIKLNPHISTFEPHTPYPVNLPSLPRGSSKVTKRSLSTGKITLAQVKGGSIDRSHTEEHAQVSRRWPEALLFHFAPRPLCCGDCTGCTPLPGPHRALLCFSTHPASHNCSCETC